MATTPAIDYDALAQQHGASIDYDALASQHGGSAGDAGSTYSKLTAGYNQGAEDFAQKHPVFGPLVRFLDAAGGAAMATPEGIYQALSHPSDTAKGALESLAAWRDPNVRKAALSVLPEALGQGVGNVAGGEATGAVTGLAKTAAVSVLPSAETIGKMARTETGTLRPGVKTAAKAAGAGIGATVGGGWGALVGEHLGTGLAESVIPDRLDAATKAERRAVPVGKNPNPEGYKGPQKTVAAGPEVSPIVPSAGSVIEGEGRPATWTNQRVAELAKQGDPRAIQQGRLRQLILPQDLNLIANKEAKITPSVGTPRSVTLFDAQGNPVPSGGVTPMADVMANRMTLNPVGETGARPIVDPALQWESSFGPEHQEVGDLAEWETGNREGVRPKKRRVTVP